MKAETRSGVVQWAAREAFGSPVIVILLSLIANEWGWLMAWLLGGVFLLTFIGQAVLLIPRSPELLVARNKRLREDTKVWDKVLLPLYGLASLATLVIAALDHRFGWGPVMPTWLQFLGLALCAYGSAVATWAMSANAFFEYDARIQSDRNHAVCTTGPYRFIRHPGYHGAMMLAAGMAVVLGSVWALGPAVIAAGLLAARTALEDRMLIAELPGYAEYAGRARRRLCPRVW